MTSSCQSINQSINKSIKTLIQVDKPQRERIKKKQNLVNRNGDKSRLISIVLTTLRDWTKQSQKFLSLIVLTCRQFSLHRRHGQDSLGNSPRAASLAGIPPHHEASTADWSMRKPILVHLDLPNYTDKTRQDNFVLSVSSV